MASGPGGVVIVTGANEFAAKLRQAASEIPNVVGRAMYEEWAIEMKESMARTPVLTGAAKASHELDGPTFRGRWITVTIMVGGAAREYIVPLHENLEVFHANGQAKFLESTVNESAPFMAARIGRRVDWLRLVS